MSVVAGALDGDLDAFLRDEGGERHEAHSRDGSGRDEGEFQTPPRRQWTEAEWREWSSWWQGWSGWGTGASPSHATQAADGGARLKASVGPEHPQERDPNLGPPDPWHRKTGHFPKGDFADPPQWPGWPHYRH